MVARLIVSAVVCAAVLAAQLHRDPLVARKLEQFQDWKFGLFLHWGAYSQMGVIESWPVVWADRKWSNPSIQTKEEMIEFRKKYFALNRTFNPVHFDPAAWARAAKRAGMKYVVFTTKHHDGFSMFDTRQTDYRVTHPDVPFSRDPRANVAKQVFDTFRRDGFGIGAYFSKSDWHSPYYWRPDVFAENRNPNYDTAADPERWGNFVKFVHGQIEELMTGYGKIDILWLDGGQVRPPRQDIAMPKLAEMARGHQPGLIIVNRTARDDYEDYRTPEQEVPEKPLPYVWESCITMGKQWSFKPDDEYKSTRELIHLLVGVVAKGGNLLLNIGPQPDGRLPATALSRLAEIGDWMQVHSEAIHGTRPVEPHFHEGVAFTRRGNTIYALHLVQEGAPLPQTLLLPVKMREGARIEVLGWKGKVRSEPAEHGVLVHVPTQLRTSAAHRYTVAFRLEGPGKRLSVSPTSAVAGRR